ncbi:MAG TPA: N-acetyltransferase [Devosia sp.]|nr:N-acetyltransferase [Devosia sp.]
MGVDYASVETVLETRRLRLTNWLPEHVDDLYALHSDPEITRYLSADGSPETREQAERRIDNWSRTFATYRLGKLRVVRKSDGVLVGRAGFGIYPPTGEPELGYALFHKYWGNGFALEAATGLRDWIFENTARDHFIGLAAIKNTASLKILEAIGMNATEVKPDIDGAICKFFILSRNQWLERKT